MVNATNKKVFMQNPTSTANHLFSFLLNIRIETKEDTIREINRVM